MNPERATQFSTIQGDVERRNLISVNNLLLANGTAVSVRIPQSEHSKFLSNQEFTCYFNNQWYILTPLIDGESLSYNSRINNVTNAAIGQLPF